MRLSFIGPRSVRGFTLIEVLVASSVLVLLLAMVIGLLNQASVAIKHASGQSTAFSSARAAFETMTQQLSQATLNTYWAYDNPNSPTRYLRSSDLHFIVRSNTTTPDAGQEVAFQAPVGYSPSAAFRDAPGLLNAVGYRVVYGSDSAFKPALVSHTQYRYRLMQALQPSENLEVFNSSLGATWVSNLFATEQPLADNIIALVVWPRLPEGEDPGGSLLAPNYAYDSRNGAASTPQDVTANQLPPVVQVTLVAVDEASMIRFDTGSATPPAEIAGALAGKFMRADQYQQDIDQLSQSLTARNIAHRILTTSITLREGKWSP